MNIPPPPPPVNVLATALEEMRSFYWLLCFVISVHCSIVIFCINSFVYINISYGKSHSHNSLRETIGYASCSFTYILATQKCYRNVTLQKCLISMTYADS